MESPTLAHPRRPRARDAWDEPRADALVLGRYRLSERLGAGGFGVVWRAHDEVLRREVAIKCIPLAPGEDGERATREALASARLSHPAIVALYEACPAEDAFYLISELVDGDTLAQLIAEDELADSQVLQIGVALCSALEHAHERGVIHRDVKPQNVLVPHGADVPAPISEAFGGVAKLTDFGGATLSGSDALTRTGDVLGTLAYMAPEQSEGRDASEAADLYSLALVLYEALSGVNPVRGATPAETVRRIGRPLRPLARVRRNVPHELARTIDRALARSPVARGSLGQLREALEQALEDGPALPAGGRGRRGAARASALDARHEDEPTELAGARHEQTFNYGRTRKLDSIGPAPIARRPTESDERDAHLQELRAIAQAGGEPAQRTPRRGLPRVVWLVAAVALAVWQAATGRPGAGLLALAAFLPVALLPIGRRDRAGTGGWLACALAPMLGVIGLAGAFPAIAGQAPRWRMRAALGALGYWWLALAEPLLARHLWLGPAADTPARTVWEGSLSSTAVHVIGPLLSTGLLLGATLWAGGAVLLPLLVRGRNAALDVVAAVAWAGALAAAAPALDAGLAAQSAHAAPRGAIVGAVLGAALAVASRALRGPV
ncbi:MAG TPA: serine/threonine-protein kinase [Solirubrobacteraceae bacterium]|nr:serine/threonine-protein kinase [Solirubrobacteraceae bacterium]